MYKYRLCVEDIETFLLEQIEDSLMLPTDNNHPDIVSYFSNGDRMDINTTTGEVSVDFVNKEKAFNSKLSLRFNQWYVKRLMEVEECVHV